MITLALWLLKIVVIIKAAVVQSLDNSIQRISPIGTFLILIGWYPLDRNYSTEYNRDVSIG